MEDNIDYSAKKLFLRYGGSPFHMERDGFYDCYLKFGVSKEQETAWLEEYKSSLFDKVIENDVVDENFIELCSALSLSKDFEMLSKLLSTFKTKDGLDIFTLIRVCEEAIEVSQLIINSAEVDKERIVLAIKRFFHELWDGRLFDPINVAPYYRSLSYLKSALSDEKLLERKRNLFDEIKQFGKS